MAVFVDAGTYLKYGNKPPGRARAILWPVLVYRVLYPEVQQPKMNLFQKTVMRLIRSKTHDAEEIAELTGLHTNLIKLIQAQLLSHDWINDQATQLTDLGLKAINEEDQQSEQLAGGYLFQDAVTGKLWPRINEDRAVIEPTNPDEQFPKFVQNRKTGKLLVPFKLKVKKAQYTIPSTQDTLRAWQDYRSDYRAAQQLYGSSQLPKQVKQAGLTYQCEHPESAWVLAWITASHNSKLWSIKDPFDIRDEAWWLTDCLPQLLEHEKNLTNSLARLIDQPEPKNQSVAEWLASLQDQATLQLMMNFPWAQKVPDIAAALTVLITRLEKLKNGQNHKSDLEAAITESQKLLEVLMQWLIKAFPADVGSKTKPGKNNWEFNGRLLAALKLPAFNEAVRKTLARQSLQAAIRCLQNPSSSLKGLVFAAALGSVGHENHPFKSLNSQELQLTKLIELADLRNQTSHGNSQYTGKKYVDITPEIAVKHIDYALQFTKQFKNWINGEKK